MKSYYPWLSALWLLTGCATGPSVRSAKDLPIKSVVLYRSGVGYFERTGSFEGDALAFGVKQREVGDFLASLTAVEQSAGGVRSVSFEVPDPVPPPRCAEGEPCPEPPDPGEQIVKVRLMLGDAERHDLNVSYVVGSPIWRPSYRVVFDQKDKALLQAWAVVQNRSGEDWSDVQLALTTGAPISFRSDLGTPITPDRPLVTDTGEVVSAVPLGETALPQESLDEAMPPPPPPPAPAMSAAPMYDREEAKEEVLAQAKKMSPSRGAVGGAAATRVRPLPKPSAAQLEQAVAVQAKAQALAGSVTRYELKHPVTILNGGSTMVAIVSTRVAGEKAHLFAPEPGVPLSSQHPFSVARLRNDSGAVLEKGPISVLSNGAFLGQGVLDTLPKDGSAFVPFALDKSLVVEAAEQYDQQRGALVRVQRGSVVVQTFSQRKTRYRVRNGTDEASKLYVRHLRWGEAELVTPPEGTELGPQRALVPVQIKAKGESTLEVTERTPVQTEFGFMDQPAADAIGVWLTGPAVDAATGKALTDALALRSELMKLRDQIEALAREQAELANGADETRQNLKAIEKVKTAADLRTRLVARLKQLDTRLAELTRQLVEARTRQSELEVRLNEALESVSLVVK
ncbi:MAG TPA: DUF4139 domain-containing protein [Polyangiales bacterium]